MVSAGAEALASSQSDKESCSHKEDDDDVCAVPTEDKSLFTSKNRSPISEMLSPILKFITSSDVFQFLKQIETHGGLRNTQLFDLSWVLNNLFNIHGGVRSSCHLRLRYTHSDDDIDLGILSPKELDNYERYFSVPWVRRVVSGPGVYPNTRRDLSQGAPCPYSNRRTLQYWRLLCVEIILSRAFRHLFRTLSEMAVCATFSGSLRELRGLSQPLDHFIIY